MWKNYLVTALRNSWKNKIFSGINVFGLAVSLSATFLIALWIVDELRFDRFHQNGDAIQRLLMIYPQEGGKLVANPNIAYPMLQQIEEKVPEVEEVVYLGYPSEQLVERKKLAFKDVGLHSNAALFSTFSYPVLHGDLSQFDASLNGIAISRSMALRFFGRNGLNEALGETLRINDSEDFTVQLIFEDVPSNSSWQFDFVMNVKHRVKHNAWLLDWGNKGMAGVLLFREGVDRLAALDKINGIYKASEAFEDGESVQSQAYQDAYLYSQFNDKAEAVKGRIAYVRLFTLAALLLLVIACINFVNLTTARSSKRAKEVGVRKAIGAGRISLIRQFLFESAVITVLAVGLAILLAEIVLPFVRLLVDKELHFQYTSPYFWLSITGIILLTAFLSGVYPAFVLSSYRTIHVLKGRVTETFRHISLRKSLVVVQFVLSLILIAGAMVIQQQINYIKNKNLGLDQDHLIYLSKEDKESSQYDLLQTELLQYPSIATVTSSSHNPTEVGASTTGVQWDGKRADQNHQEFKMLWVENNFLEGFDVQLKEGRFYDPAMRTDTSNIVLNEAAIAVMGLENPVGKRIRWWGDPVTIIGVVKDFHVGSLYEPIEPLAIILEEDMGSWMFIRTEEGQTEEALAALQTSFAKVFPGTPLDHHFLDERYESNYKSEMLTGTLARYFGMLAIIISCLGLLGLSVFLAEQKTKEIGIRKVIGASTGHIIQLLSRDFLGLVGLGLALGIPVAWYLLDLWLAKFEYGIELNWWMFALPAILAIAVAVLTVGVQSLKAALSRPVEALRAE